MKLTAPISTEHIRSFQQQPGIGNKTIFKIAEDVKTPITTVKEI